VAWWFNPWAKFRSLTHTSYKYYGRKTDMVSIHCHQDLSQPLCHQLTSHHIHTHPSVLLPIPVILMLMQRPTLLLAYLTPQARYMWLSKSQAGVIHNLCDGPALFVRPLFGCWGNFRSYPTPTISYYHLHDLDDIHWLADSATGSLEAEYS